MKVLPLALIAIVGLASPVLAQNDKKPATPVTPAPGQPGKGDMKMPSPEEMKKMQEMMASWEAAGTPGKEHEVLTKQAGTWDGKVSSYEMPGQPATESKCECKIQSIMGGRFTKLDVHGKMPMQGQMMDFEGFGLYGYENAAKKYTMSWCDNMGTGIMKGTGELSADGKTLTWTMSCEDPYTHKQFHMREVDTFVNDNQTKLEMFGENPFDPKHAEMKMMEIDFKRTGEAPKAEKHDGKGEKHENKEGGKK